MDRIKAVAVGALFLVPSSSYATTDYCAEVGIANDLECWNQLIDEKEATLKRVISASIRQVRGNEGSYGLDTSETLRLIGKSQQAWEEYVAQECAVQREAVGSGNDRNSQEMSCHLEKLDARILEVIKHWPQ